MQYNVDPKAAQPLKHKATRATIEPTFVCSLEEIKHRRERVVKFKKFIRYNFN